MPVPAVARIPVLVAVPAVARLFIQPGVKAAVHELRDDLLEKLPDILHAADAALLQELPDFCPPGRGSSRRS